MRGSCLYHGRSILVEALTEPREQFKPDSQCVSKERLGWASWFKPIMLIGHTDHSMKEDSDEQKRSMLLR